MRYLTSLVILVSLISYSKDVNGQSPSDWQEIYSGQWIFDLNPSPYVLLYKLEFFFDEDSNKVSVEDVLLKNNVNLDTIPFAKIKLQDNQFLVIRKNNGNYRLFKILKSASNYFLLCSDNNSICDCGAETFIYYIPKKKLQRIQRPFSFSLKRNLIYRCHYFQIKLPSNFEELDFCELMENMGK